MNKKDELLIGFHSVIEAIESGKQIDKIFIKKSYSNELNMKVLELARAHSIVVKNVPVEKLNRLTRKAHQGIVAIVSPIEYQQVEDILLQTFEKGETPLFLVLDGITDTRNLGAIARTAECTGVHAIIVGKHNSAQISSETVKTSAGALMHIPVCRVDKLSRTLLYLKDSGIQVCAANEKSSYTYNSADLKLPTAIIMGAEDTGISQNLLDLSDCSLAIPILGKVQSLNVSVASGVLLYEVVRQRTKN